MLRLFLKSFPGDVTDEEVAYFRDHPDEIEEVTSPVNVHKFFLWAGALRFLFGGLSLVAGVVERKEDATWVDRVDSIK